MIADHVWRPPLANTTRRIPAGQCWYMNCRRPRDQHERAVSGKCSR